MRADKLDAYVVRGTDRFLNEYVPTGESTRVWLSGFAGSTGDALVTLDTATMFVDGRYALQAQHDLDASHWKLDVLPLGVANERAWSDRVVALARARTGGTLRVGFEPDRFSIELFESVKTWTSGAPLEFVPTLPTLIERVRGTLIESRGNVRAVSEIDVGRTVDEKIAFVSEWLAVQGARALLVQRLDELAYVTNLRGDELPFQSTFRSIALVTLNEIVVAVDLTKVPASVRAARPSIRFVAEAEILAEIASVGGGTIACDPAGTTVALRNIVEQSGARVLLAPSPLTVMKAKKTAAELRAMRSAFERADRVVIAAQRWLIDQVVGGATITETDFAAQVERMFRESGAVGLSFKVISACGENAADVHHPPDPSRVIRRGEMMLLDTGAYYEEGYATDLTRTFFVGNEQDVPTEDMRRYFTLTLKSAIAGMTARMPRTAVGAQLDGISRAPLWGLGLEYSHGTGHGVGINVHESPPRVASVSLMKFEEGHVFSIEPGIYLAGKLGVRIENLCTVVPDPADERFLQVEPMTFSPLDARLIDSALLGEAEKDFLVKFAAGGKSAVRAA